MEHCLAEKPEVIVMAETLGIDEFAVVGRLHRVWVWFSSHTADGCAPSVTPSFIDRLVSLDGFAAAMTAVDWLHARNGSLAVPNFDRHNAKSAKSRALAAVRMNRSRYAPSVTDAQPEKRREEKRSADAGASASGRTRASPGSARKRRSPGASQSARGSPPAIVWSAEAGWSGITDADRTAWAEAYPACDVDRQLRAMSEWLRANPAKAHKSNWRRFIVNWLKREQDRGGDAPRGRSAAATGGRHRSGASDDDYDRRTTTVAN